MPLLASEEAEMLSLSRVKKGDAPIPTGSPSAPYFYIMGTAVGGSTTK